MKAFIIDRYSKEDPMRLGEMPSPQVRDGDVLIEVHATGLNLIDSKIKSGEFKLVLPYRFPLVLGHDVAGVVTRVGSRVRQFKVGDEVYARPAAAKKIVARVQLRPASSLPMSWITMLWSIH